MGTKEREDKSQVGYLEDNNQLVYPSQFILNEVKVTPPYMLFENAYEGKEYSNKMMIQNCGTRSVFIRLFEPSAKMFRYKSFKDGKYLSPGMRIIRTVNFKYKSGFGVRKAFATFWVNGTEADYFFFITLSKAIMSVEPQQLDFGRLDAVNHATTLTFFIRNTGLKGTQFAIDLGRNALELIVEPLKGVAPAKTSIPIKVEIVGTEEGDFAEEIWVKTSPPLRVVITGTFISPKLLVRKFINTLDFTLVNFSKTYFGSASSKCLLIRNFSASDSMFCIMAEIKGTTMTLEEARKVDDNYNNFEIHPLDGRIMALKGAMIQIIFTPTYKNKKERSYSACFCKIIRMDCRDLKKSDKLTGSINRLELPRGSSALELTNASTGGTGSRESMSDSAIISLLTSYDSDDNSFDEKFTFEHAIRVCLHGENEKAKIFLRPFQIKLDDLVLNKTYNRELYVQNKSVNLPIRVRYTKIPAIDVFPKQFDLQPSGSIEVLITIRPLKLDRVDTYVTFDLLARDQYWKSSHFRKVGRSRVRISFESNAVEVKKRLDQCVLCKEVVPKLGFKVVTTGASTLLCANFSLKNTRLEPEFPFMLSGLELARKLSNDEYYLEYIRSLERKQQIQNTLPDDDEYPINIKILKCERILKDEEGEQLGLYTTFIPLTPTLLYNIKISPKSIRLRKVAAYTTITDYFEVENLNTFPIYVFAKASKPCIYFEHENRIQVRGQEKRKVFFSFSSSSVGRYYISIHVLVNNTTLYEITAVANVIPKTLRVETSEVIFTEKDGNFLFLKMINALNSYTSFDWEVPYGCFKIFPEEGGIRAERYILCMIEYVPDPLQPNYSECVLTSESGQKRIVNIVYRKRQHLAVFDTYEIDLGIIALNIPIRKKLTLKNLMPFQMMFSIPGGVQINGITIEPSEGVLEGLSSQVFVITVHLKSIIEFSTNIIFNIEEEEEISINLKGFVDFPMFKFKPELLQFRKISPYSFDTLAFKVKNLSRCESFVMFPTEEFPEFRVTESEDNQATSVTKLVLPPEKSKILYLHFQPNYVATCSFYLPYKINDILGPVLINSNTSSSADYYLQDNDLLYEGVPGVHFPYFPKHLPVIRINSGALEKTLEFSSLTLDFQYYGQDHYGNVTKKKFVITNVGLELVELCIRIDELAPPFFLTPTDIGTYDTYPVAYKVTLKPTEKIIFEVEFEPFEVGAFQIRLPLFLRHYYNNKIFNYLTLNGTYATPLMIPSRTSCHFEPVPPNISSDLYLNLRMLNHLRNCRMTIDSDESGIGAMFKKEDNFKEEDYILNVTISYKTSRTHCFDCVVTFECSCCSKCNIKLTGVVENCLFTTHAFVYLVRNKSDNVEKRRSTLLSRNWSRHISLALVVNVNNTSFPLFPTECDTSGYAVYMRQLQKTLENWLFSQAFYKKTFIKIPEGFSDYCKIDQAPHKKVFGGYAKPKSVLELPLLQFILNITGQHFRDKLAPSFPKTDDELEWLTYTYTTNSNILCFLRSFRIFVPHVHAKLLLNYDYYKIYQKMKHPTEQCLDEKTFYRRSKQCYIDLLLQTIKVFFFFRSMSSSDDEDIRCEDSPSRQFRQSFSTMSRLSDSETDNVIDITNYGKCEKELLFWLQTIYDQERSTLWTVPGDPKEFLYLDDDLRDGLALGAVTAHYCPYVKSELCSMYTDSLDDEELHHNCCVLVKTWQMLKLSYVISPLTLKKGDVVEMLLLLNYLHDVLPFHTATEDITIEAPLTKGNSSAITLHNTGEDIIYYKVVFFGNDNKQFTVPHGTITVEPRKKKNVKIKYHAKRLNTVHATLLFSGETPGQKYGRSVAVNLVGVTDVFHATMTIPIAVDLYKPCEIKINIQAPFKVKANYTIMYGYQPSASEKNILFSWDILQKLRINKEFVLEQEHCDFDETGKSEESRLICCQQLGPRNVWVYFLNSEIGDFGIHLPFTGKVNEVCFENLEIALPENYENLVCKCRRKPSLTSNCPLILNIDMPMMNNPLWKARKDMVLHFVKGDELEFWRKRIFTPLGTRIMKLMIGSEYYPLGLCLEETVEYSIQLDKPQAFITLKKLVIPDVFSEELIQFPIHPIKNLLEVPKTTMRLISGNGKEHRFYRLFFKATESSKQNPAEVVDIEKNK